MTLIIKHFRPFDTKDKKMVEKIFDVGLEDRTWNISLGGLHPTEVEISFYDKDNCFGYVERIPIAEFVQRLDKNDLYLKL
jgi:hypothetical protein